MGINDKNAANLSLEEQTKIKEEMKEAIANFDPKRPKLSDEVNMDIRLGVNSGVKELFDIGCELAYVATLNHYKKIAIKYQDPPRTEVDDLINLELFSTIQNNIKNFDGIHSLYTYFDPYVRATFMKAREKGRGHVLTKHYMDSAVTISRARRALEVKKLSDVSSLDLSKWIKTYMNKDISPTTIERIDEMSISLESLDAKSTATVDPLSEDPARIIEQKYSEEKFWNTVGTLSDRHKKFMAAAIDFIDQTGSTPDQSDAYAICKSFIPDVTKDQAIRLMRATYSEFKRFSRKYRRNSELPINNMRMIEDIRIMEEEEMEIESSLMEDPGFFDDEDLNENIEEIFSFGDDFDD